MKTALTSSILVLLLLFAGCTRHIKPEKFDVYPDLIKNFSGEAPIRIVVPENAEKEYLIEYKDPKQASGKIYVDLQDLYDIAKGLMENELKKHDVPVNANAGKTITFTIQKVQWEIWAGGFSLGAYMDFLVETGDGYQMSYSVQDGSAMDVNRSVGGVITRSVEKIFQDEKILAYIEN